MLSKEETEQLEYAEKEFVSLVDRLQAEGLPSGVLYATALAFCRNFITANFPPVYQRRIWLALAEDVGVNLKLVDDEVVN